MRQNLAKDEIEIAGVLIWLELEDKVVIFSGASEKKDINKYLLLFIQIGNSLTLN